MRFRRRLLNVVQQEVSTNIHNTILQNGPKKQKELFNFSIIAVCFFSELSFPGMKRRWQHGVAAAG